MTRRAALRASDDSGAGGSASGTVEHSARARKSVGTEVDRSALLKCSTAGTATRNLGGHFQATDPGCKCARSCISQGKLGAPSTDERYAVLGDQARQSF